MREQMQNDASRLPLKGLSAFDLGRQEGLQVGREVDDAAVVVLCCPGVDASRSMTASRMIGSRINRTDARARSERVIAARVDVDAGARAIKSRMGLPKDRGATASCWRGEEPGKAVFGEYRDSGPPPALAIPAP